MSRVLVRTVLLTLGIAVALAARTPAASRADQRERFTALAVLQGGPGAAVPVDIVINRWSSDADRDRLLNTLTEQGSKKLLDLLQDMPEIGSLATPGSVGIQVRFAQRTTLPTGAERIMLLTDRPMAFFEMANQTRSTEYPFSVIQLQINSNGRGEGTASLATKIRMDADTKTIVLENYDIRPVTLTGIRRLTDRGKE
jgi:hypothetical protein